MRGLALILVFLVAACSSPADESRRQKETLKSWSATLDLMEKEWNQSLLPYVYVRKTLQAAEKELDSQAKDIRKLEVDAQDKQQMLKQLQSIKARAAAMMQAAEKRHQSGK